MTPIIIAKGLKASESLKNHITERLGAILSRTKNHLDDITIRLSDLNGSRNGADKRCLIRVKLFGMSPIVVTGLGSDITSAIDIASSRISKAVGRVLSKAKSIPHVTMPLYIKKSFLAT